METSAKKIIYFETNNLQRMDWLGGNWGLTDAADDESINTMVLYANVNKDSIRLATMEDLYEYSALDGKVIEGLLQVEEGLCQWQYKQILDEITGEIELDGGYVNLLECVEVQ